MLINGPYQSGAVFPKHFGTQEQHCLSAVTNKSPTAAQQSSWSALSSSRTTMAQLVKMQFLSSEWPKFDTPVLQDGVNSCPYSSWQGNWQCNLAITTGRATCPGTFIYLLVALLIPLEKANHLTAQWHPCNFGAASEQHWAIRGMYNSNDNYV